MLNFKGSQLEKDLRNANPSELQKLKYLIEIAVNLEPESEFWSEANNFKK